MQEKILCKDGVQQVLQWEQEPASAPPFLFMLFVYRVNHKTIAKKIKNDRVSVNESYRFIMKIILLIAAPIILSAFIYNVNGILME